MRYGFLPSEEREAKVKAEVASAAKKAKHPTKKGEFIYRFWRGCQDADKSMAVKSRTKQFEAGASMSLQLWVDFEHRGFGPRARLWPRTENASNEAQPRGKSMRRRPTRWRLRWGRQPPRSLCGFVPGIKGFGCDENRTSFACEGPHQGGARPPRDLWEATEGALWSERS